jgi:hypothetical protein
MKIKMLILSSLLLLAFCAINAYSVDWANQGSQTVDQMISGDEANNTGPGINPWASRAAQVGEKGKDILSVTIGGKLVTGASNPQEARNQAQTQAGSAQPVVANNTAPAQSTPAEAVSIAGTWSFELSDSASKSATLTLLQGAGGAVYGKGAIMEGNDTFTAAATGSIVGDMMSLDLVSLEKLSLYRLTLALSGDSATGSYNLFNAASEASQAGTANATKI